MAQGGMGVVAMAIGLRVHQTALAGTRIVPKMFRAVDIPTGSSAGQGWVSMLGMQDKQYPKPVGGGGGSWVPGQLGARGSSGASKTFDKNDLAGVEETRVATTPLWPTPHNQTAAALTNIAPLHNIKSLGTTMAGRNHPKAGTRQLAQTICHG